jgi:hypothetical protein
MPRVSIRAARLRVEDSGQSVFHPPIQSVGAFQEKALCFLGDIVVILLCIFQIVHVGHIFSPFLTDFKTHFLTHYRRLNIRVKKNHLLLNKVCGISAISRIWFWRWFYFNFCQLEEADG